jgi:hypothetical protein
MSWYQFSTLNLANVRVSRFIDIEGRLRGEALACILGLRGCLWLGAGYCERHYAYSVASPKSACGYILCGRK